MSKLTHLLITTDAHSESFHSTMLALDAWCDEHADGQRFTRLSTDAAGGHKRWCLVVLACCGNYFPTRAFIKAFPSFGWSSYTADTTILVVRDEDIHAGDAWIALDGHGGAITKEVDL